MSLLQKTGYWLKNPKYAINRIIVPPLLSMGYSRGQWSRVVMDKEISSLLGELDTEKMRAMEISPNPAGSRWLGAGFDSFTDVHYPDFDICKDQLEDKFDIIIADQVFEHLKYPYKAARNIFDMLSPGGYFLNTTPFLIRFHGCPDDYSRWTEQGMVYFLEEIGFYSEQTKSGSWGNRKCVVANLKKNGWSPYGFGKKLKDEPEYPVVVWALARKPL